MTVLGEPSDKRFVGQTSDLSRPPFHGTRSGERRPESRGRARVVRRSRTIFAVLLAISAPTFVGAQDALVLSGGGSRGLAHAGAVVGLDSLGFDPDLVVGTSMGAIIGGLYAAGYTPRQIWSFVENRDWQETFSPVAVFDGPDRASHHPVLRVELAPARKRLPKGAVVESQINRLLVRYLFDAGARSLGNFDHLPRRFRAMVADLATGEGVVVDRGDLPRAVRASMAVPGVFGAVPQGDKVWVDGGLANYLPVEVAQKAGARRVVAVDVLRPAEEIESLSPLWVGSRGFHLFNMNARQEDAEPDVLIVPSLKQGLTAASFLIDAERYLREGLRAALDTLAAHPGLIDGRKEALKNRSSPPPPKVVGELEVEASEEGMRSLARRAFAEVLSAPYDHALVLEAVDRLYGTGLFDGVWPRVEPAGNGAGAGQMVVRVDPIPRLLLSAAVAYENDRGGLLWASVRQRVTEETWPVTLGISGALGGLDRWGSFAVEAPVPQALPTKVVAEIHVREREVRFAPAETDTLAPVADEGGGVPRVRRIGGAVGIEATDVTRGLTVQAAFRAEALRHESGSEGASLGPFVRLQGEAPLVRAVGEIPLMEAEWRFGAESYWRLRARGSWDAREERLSVALTGDVEVADSEAPLDVTPSLGSEHVMPGLRWDAERGRGRLVGGVDVGYPLPLQGVMRLRVRGGALFDALDGGADEGVAGAELAGVWWSPLGGIHVGVGGNTLGEWRFDVSLGAGL